MQAAVTAARALRLQSAAQLNAGLHGRLRRWTVAYIGLLHRLRLWATAAVVVARASDDGVRLLNSQYTALSGACGGCGEQVAPVPWGESEEPEPEAEAEAGGEERVEEREVERASVAARRASRSPAPVFIVAFSPDGAGAGGEAQCSEERQGGAADGCAADASRCAEEADDCVRSSCCAERRSARVGKMLTGAPCRCARCSRTLGLCAVCQLPVRGVWVWCQGCGHGGHLSHMHAWFQAQSLCPTGCLHVCTLAVVK